VLQGPRGDFGHSVGPQWAANLSSGVHRESLHLEVNCTVRNIVCYLPSEAIAAQHTRLRQARVRGLQRLQSCSCELSELGRVGGFRNAGTQSEVAIKRRPGKYQGAVDVAGHVGSESRKGGGVRAL